MTSPFFGDYAARLRASLEAADWSSVEELAKALRGAWKAGKRVFVIGNGGSAANAMHLANDFLYGISRSDGQGLKVHALTADSSIMTCLANDVSYAEIFSRQLAVLAEPGDILIALSGSGNSPNVVRALELAKEKKMHAFAILGYSGGKCLELADTAIHFPVQDMQLAEDLQLIVGHMVMRWLCENPVKGAEA